MTLPESYVFEQLALRWHVDPERLETMRADTILRGLAFMGMEAQATAKGGSDGKT